MTRLLKNISLDELKFLLEFGKPKKKASIFELRLNHLEELEPVFFLSTGRAGTKWFSNIIRKDKSVKVLHDPYPDFAVQNKFAYELLHQENREISQDHLECIKEIYLTGRENYLRYSFKTNKRLIETNSSITFFAPILAELFPKSKFVHLVRPPEEFVLSGLNRGYYSNHPQEIRRIISQSVIDKWDNLTQVEKIAWLWKETNDFIDTFERNINKNRFTKFYFKEIQSDKVKEILSFINVKASKKFIEKRIRIPVNIQKKNIADQLSEESLKTISSICMKSTNKI